MQSANHTFFFFICNGNLYWHNLSEFSVFIVVQILYQVRNMTVLVHSFLMCFVIWFCHVIIDFPIRLSSKFSIFVILLFIVLEFYLFQHIKPIDAPYICCDSFDSNDYVPYIGQGNLVDVAIDSESEYNSWISRVTMHWNKRLTSPIRMVAFMNYYSHKNYP